MPGNKVRKATPSPRGPRNEMNNKDAAATKIQARFRGYLCRKGSAVQKKKVDESVYNIFEEEEEVILQKCSCARKASLCVTDTKYSFKSCLIDYIVKSTNCTVSLKYNCGKRPQ